MFIESARAISERVKELYAKIETPVMVDLRLEVDGVPVYRSYPRTLPDLYKGDELRISTRVRAKGRAQLALHGVMGGKPVVFRGSVEIAEQSAPWVGRLWAESRIDDLLEEIALQGETDELKGEVIKLATAYNFASPYTSFLAIPESELTDEARDTLEEAQARKAKILAAHKDALALSRSAMPPGDPVLRVKAPRDAQQVTAYFPFGLEKDLVYDESKEAWTVRFLVPNTVADGEYKVKVVIVHAKGQIEMAEIPYTIDSNGPEFEINSEIKGDALHVEVRSAEALRSATFLAVDGTRIDLELSEDKLSLVGTVPLGTGGPTLPSGRDGRSPQRNKERAFGSGLTFAGGASAMRRACTLSFALALCSSMGAGRGEASTPHPWANTEYVEDFAYLDRGANQGLWVATRGGLELYDLSSGQRKRHLSTLDGLPEMRVRQLEVTGSELRLWTSAHRCTLSGKGLNCAEVEALPNPEPKVGPRFQGARVTKRATVGGFALVATAGAGNLAGRKC